MPAHWQDILVQMHEAGSLNQSLATDWPCFVACHLYTSFSSHVTLRIIGNWLIYIVPIFCHYNGRCFPVWKLIYRPVSKKAHLIMVNLQVSKEGGEEKERGSIVARLQLFPPFHTNCSLLSSVLRLENQSIYNFFWCLPSDTPKSYAFVPMLGEIHTSDSSRKQCFKLLE